MRTTRRLLQLSEDAFKTHVGDRSEFWKKVREALVVNPESSTGNPLPTEHRVPTPASRPEKFVVPASKASDIADNPYWKRDFRRMYPKTEVVTQPELAQLLLTQGGFQALPEPGQEFKPKSPEQSKALVTGQTKVPSLSSVYNTSSAKSYKPPTPPGRKYRWTPASEKVPHPEHAYFPMTNWTTKV